MRQSPTNQRLIASQLEQLFAKLRALPDLRLIPTKGWIHAIRQALGLTTTQLAQKVGVHQTRISRIEDDEIEGALTLRTMKEVASAMNCDFVYSIVPRQPIQTMLNEQAHKIAQKQLKYVLDNMALEGQTPTAASIDAERQRLIAELLAGNPKHLWEE